MGNIYIETDENFRVTKVHNMPLDPVNGMGYTREELEQKGYFVDEIPAPINKTGRRAIKMYNPDTKSIYYEYIGIPMSDKERINYLENAMNFIAKNALYGAQGIPAMYSMRTMALDEEPVQEEVDPQVKAIGEYLAYQIIAGKLEVENVLAECPQCENVIKETLMENGIQI